MRRKPAPSVREEAGAGVRPGLSGPNVYDTKRAPANPDPLPKKCRHKSVFGLVGDLGSGSLGGTDLAGEYTGASSLAGRYALALYELADEAKQLDAVATEFRGLQDMIAGSDDLQRLIASPIFNRDQQGRAMLAILEKAGVSDLTRRFVLTVADNRRLFALPRMIAAYLAELARRRGEVMAEVVAARALSDGQHQALTEALRKSVGAKVQVDVTVDPALIGGLVVRVGSRMVDSSLRTKLQKLQLAMKGVG